MQIHRAIVAFALILVACSSSSSPSSDTDAGKSSGVDGGGSSENPSGTIFGSAFTPTSGFAFMETDSTFDLIFTSTADACGDARDETIRGGGTYVQLFDLAKQADGTWANEIDPGDTKATELASDCGSGSKTTTASSTTVHIDSTSGPVVGSLDITFTDGSTFAGSFSLPICASTIVENSLCR